MVLSCGQLQWEVVIILFQQTGEGVTSHKSSSNSRHNIYKSWSNLMETNYIIIIILRKFLVLEIPKNISLKFNTKSPAKNTDKIMIIDAIQSSAIIIVITITHMHTHTTPLSSTARPLGSLNSPGPLPSLPNDVRN